jgi:hypothetical protein
MAMKIDFPEGVKEIILAVHKEVKKGKPVGPSGDVDEDALQVVVDRIRTKWMGTPERTMEVWDWAAKQYLKLLLIDQRRFEFFRSHELCDPPGKDCEKTKDH